MPSSTSPRSCPLSPAVWLRLRQREDLLYSEKANLYFAIEQALRETQQAIAERRPIAAHALLLAGTRDWERLIQASRHSPLPDKIDFWAQQICALWETTDQLSQQIDEEVATLESRLLDDEALTPVEEARLAQLKTQLPITLTAAVEQSLRALAVGLGQS